MIYDVDRIGFSEDKIDRRVLSDAVPHNFWVQGIQNDWSIRHNPFYLMSGLSILRHRHLEI